MHKWIVLGLFSILSASAATTPTSVPIDSKKELAGITLGQSIDSLNKGIVVASKTDQFLSFDVKDIAERTPNHSSLALKPMPGATYGGLPIKDIGIAAFYGIIYQITLFLDNDPKTDKMPAILEGIALKYTTTRKDGVTKNQDQLVIVGDDIVLTVIRDTPYINLTSKKLQDQAKETFLKKNEEAKQRHKQEAAKILNDL